MIDLVYDAAALVHHDHRNVSSAATEKEIERSLDDILLASANYRIFNDKSIMDDLQPTPEQKRILRRVNCLGLAENFQREVLNIHHVRLCKIADANPSKDSFAMLANYIKANTVQDYRIIMSAFVDKLKETNFQSQDEKIRVNYNKSRFVIDNAAQSKVRRQHSPAISPKQSKRPEWNMHQNRGVKKPPRKKMRTAIPCEAKAILAEWLLTRYEVSSSSSPPDLYAQGTELDNLSTAAGIHSDRVKIYLTNHRARSKGKTIPEAKAQLNEVILMAQNPICLRNRSSCNSKCKYSTHKNDQQLHRPTSTGGDSLGCMPSLEAVFQ